MFKDRDFDSKAGLLPNGETLVQDLELKLLFDAMANGDDFLLKVAKSGVLSSLKDVETISYRQDILRDCLKSPSVIRKMYEIAVESVDAEKKTYFGFYTRYIAGILDSSIAAMNLFLETLGKLRKIADEHSGDFESEGFGRFFSMIEDELSDEYLETVKEYLEELKFDDGILIGEKLGEGNKGKDYVLRKPHPDKRKWFERIFSRKDQEYAFRIDDRDERGAKALSDLKDRGINPVANALAKSAGHVLDFFTVLRRELAFYIGAMNLHDRLKTLGNPTCFPSPILSDDRKLFFESLYEPSLALILNGKIVGNDLDADSKALFVVTGANRGGKSVFLRSIGTSRLMMQCGIFVPAKSFSANVCNGFFTHYKREEDAWMNSGKFDEEMSRMNEIAEKVKPGSIVMFNESFATTNEKEGSEIAGQIVTALVEKGVEVFFVTHMYKFANSMYEKEDGGMMFLKAERFGDGTRSFRIKEGIPLQTSYGVDLYEKVFGTDEIRDENRYSRI